ncbi:MAG: hypothetical protein IAI48_03575 [Candidatus Eremiobacteraeota bacterium]|nr:hypothetical protein [Candidatus Eremiobacteraeota bacterium]
MPERFLGFDHIDLRVASLDAVEAFYVALLPALGLVRRVESFVDRGGVWRKPRAGERYNVIEYSEELGNAGPPRFLGIVEDAGMIPVESRVAFAVATPQDVRAWASRLAEIGACNVEFEDDFDAYPAVFFEDPAGTRLELCARRNRPVA